MLIEVDNVNRLAGRVLQCLHDIEHGVRTATHRYIDIGGFRPALGRQNRAHDVGPPDTKRLTEVQQSLSDALQYPGLVGSQPASPISYRLVADPGVEAAELCGRRCSPSAIHGVVPAFGVAAPTRVAG